MKIVIELILLAVIVLVGFAVYKLISREMKKSLEVQTKILNECKTEEERNAALILLKRKNIKKVIISSLCFFIGLPIVILLLMLLIRRIPHVEIKPLGSYELFSENGITYYGKHDYSIFCYNNGILAFSSYKIFNKKNKSVFETNSYENFMSKLEDMFKNQGVEKINFYGTCLSDPGFKSLGYALDNSHLVESHEIEKVSDAYLIHIKTVNGTAITIEYLWDDMICTCKGA